MIELNDALKKPTPCSNGLRQGFGSQELRGMIKFKDLLQGNPKPVATVHEVSDMLR